jgi:hypothetical protein
MIIGHHDAHAPRKAGSSAPKEAPKKPRRKFLTYYPKGFRDPSYLELERGYKEAAHVKWLDRLNPEAFRSLLKRGRYHEIADEAVRIESRTNLLFSFEKMAIRDAIKSDAGARLFAQGLYEFLHGPGGEAERFERWVATVAKLPRVKTRVLTWPVATVFGFLAQPEKHLFLKPTVTRRAAERYGYPFRYSSRPNWETYADALEFAGTVKRDLRELKPKDMLDLQGFIWVQGSDEYPG